MCIVARSILFATTPSAGCVYCQYGGHDPKMTTILMMLISFAFAPVNVSSQSVERPVIQEVGPEFQLNSVTAGSQVCISKRMY